MLALYERRAAQRIGNVEIIGAGAVRKTAPRGSNPAAGVAAPPVYTLPWPPSGNTAVRHAKGRHYLRPEVQAYRNTVAAILGGSSPIGGAYALEVVLSPPDKRKRDADNALKSILDALKGVLVVDDSMAYMRRLQVIVEGERGDVRVSVLELA